MRRSGTVTVLGAGASAEAGYPPSEEFLEKFKAVLKETSRQEIAGREKVKRQQTELQEKPQRPGEILLLAPIREEPTTEEWFLERWAQFKAAQAKLRPLGVPNLGRNGRPDLSSPVVYGPQGVPVFPPYPAAVEDHPSGLSVEPYLETFFAFYDAYMRPMIAATRGDPGKLTTTQYRFRKLRELAVRCAFHELAAYELDHASYLRRLFNLKGPDEVGWAIATLNFDVTIEQIAAAANITFQDGFAVNAGPVSPPPPDWIRSENPHQLWGAVAENCHEFVGFDETDSEKNRLLKLHGSLGWYVLEEGGGDIGARDELRHNTAYAFFRCPYDFFWRLDMKGLSEQLSHGGNADPITRTNQGSISRKAGAVCLRPYLIFARALKTHPDRLSITLIGEFSRLLEKAANILVVGYSWGDPHINDLILDNVARGATLVSVSSEAQPKNALAIWRHRFPTTYPQVRKRLFMFGGGAKNVLEKAKVKLGPEDMREFDVVESLGTGLPQDLSLETSDRY